MIELLTKRVEFFEDADQVVLPLAIGEDIVSLSAIVLNDDYYTFLMDNKVELYGIILADERVLIPLKVSAYLNLKRRKEAGEDVKGDDIKKHRNDVIRLSVILPNEPLLNVPEIVKNEIWTFIDELNDDGDLLRNLGVTNDIDSIKILLKTVYGVD